MKRVLGLLAFVAFLTLGVLWFVQTHEQREVNTPVPPQQEAFEDKFLAAQRLLAKFEVKSRSVTGLETRYDIAPDAVLVLPAPRGMLSKEGAQRLREQVEQGGNLIVESESHEIGDVMLDTLQVTRTEHDLKPCSEPYFGEYASWRDRTQSASVKSMQLLDVDVLDGAPIRASMAGGETLSMEGETAWQLAGCDGVRALHFALGQGRVTVVNDISFVTNWGIGRNDNAEFFWRLAQQGGKPGEVVFMGPTQAGLWSWLNMHAWRALAASAMLIMLWLWSLAPRFGPLRPDPEPVRRRLLDHLRANGRLLWQLGAKGELARAARELALARIAQEHPHARTLSTQDFSALLERRYQLPRAWIGLLLPGASANTPQSFLALIRACRVLHAKGRGKHAAVHDPLYASEE